MLADEMVSLCRELGLEKIKVRGDNVMFCCPSHGENNPSCGISITKEIGGCFACGWHFNLIQLVAFCKQIQEWEAVEYLNSYFNRDFRKVDCAGKFPLYSEDKKSVSSFLPHTALAPFRSGEISHPYLIKRGFSEQDFINFKLGWDSNLKRITIPFYDTKGNLLGFSGRAVLNESNPNYEVVYGNSPKYLIYNNFKAKDTLFPLNLYKKSDTLILVEGLLDALWLHKMQFTNTLSVISAQISRAQLEILKSLDVKTIILCLDNDKYGEAGCKKLYDNLKGNFVFKKVIFPEGKKDVQECTKEELDFMFKNLINYPMRNFKFYEGE